MGVKKVYNPNHFDLGAIGESLSLDDYIKAIQTKPENERTALERRILSLYNQANEAGTNFCIKQLKEEIKRYYREQPLLFFIGAAVAAYFLYKIITK